jgi:hypothetical protein
MSTYQEPVAVYEAVSAIYFADNSDYLPALWSVVQSLAPDLALLLESNPSAAWHQAKKLKDSELATPPATQPAPVPLTDDARGLLVIERLGPNALLHKPMSIYEAFHAGIDAAETAHGIAEKGQP